MNKKLLTTSVFLATSIAMAFEPWIGSSTPTPYYVNTGLAKETTTAAGYWFVKDDYEEGGKSKVVWPVETEKADPDSLAPIIQHCQGVCGTAKLNKGTLTYNPFVTVGFNVAGKNENGELVSGKASDWGGICITYRSDAAPSLELSMGDADDAAIGYALPTKKLEKSENGKSYRTCIPWSDFKQPTWGKENTKISGTDAAANLVSINFKMQGAKGQYKFNICAIGPYSDGSDNLPESCPDFHISLEIPEISVSATWVQGDDGYDATITVMDGEKELTEGTDYEIESNVNDATGIVIKTITGKGDYAGSVVKSLVPYIDENGEPQVMYDATVLTNNKGGVTELNGGWYVATGKVNMAGIKFNGEAHLILADDATLDVEDYPNTIEATENLTIYGQTKQSGTLKATGVFFGIRSYKEVTISGGSVTADGDDNGIYGSKGVTISGGSVTATGNNYGIFSNNGVTISGGSVTATATGENGNGIGDGIYGYEGVSISGGTVTASGNDYGIYSKNEVSISGGTVTASGENGNGIGDGDGIYGYEGVTISGGSVTATSEYEGIYSDNGVSISGGTVTVTSNNRGIVGSNEVSISGGSVTATGNVVGIFSEEGIITLDWTNSTDFIYASSYYSENGSVQIAKDKSFKDKDGNEYSGTIDDVSDIAGKTLVPSFNGKFLSDVNIAVADIPVQKYADGKPVCPSVVVTDGKDTLKAGTDYTVVCSNNTAVTSANLDEAAIAQITGKGNYAGAIQKRFFIWENIGNYAAVQVYKDKMGDSHAEIDGAYDGTDAVAYDEDITVKSVVFNREFSVKLENGGFSTIMLPFDVKASNLTGVKSVFEFAKVVDHTVGVTYVWCNATIGEQQSEKGNPNCNNELSGELKAYTPYLIEMETPTLGIEGGVVLKSTTKAKPDVSNENWVFRGVLQKKDFSENDQAIQKGIIWAFAGSARKGASIGEFVQFGNNTWVNPFRAYLVDCTKYPDASECKDDETQPEPSLVSRYRFADVFAPASSAENSLSAKVPMRVAASETASLEGMEVVIMNGDKERPTVIGHMNPATGEIRMLPRTKQTYDLKGRRVNEGRKAKGAYYRK